MRSVTASTSPAATRHAPVVGSKSVRVRIGGSCCEGLSDRAVPRSGGGGWRHGRTLRRRRALRRGRGRRTRRRGRRGLALRRGRRRRTAEGGFNRARRWLIDIPLERSEESAADFAPRVGVGLQRRETVEALLRPRVVEPPPHQLEVLLVDRDRFLLERVRGRGELLLVVLDGVRAEIGWAL